MKKIKYPARIIDESITYLKHHSSTVLTCVGSAGVILTAVMTAKATVKAVRLINEAECQKKEELTKMEIFQATATAYFPAVLIGASTIACIFGANALNKQQQAALISAYSLVDRSFKEYKEKLKELYGEEAHQEIINSIVVEKAAKMHVHGAYLFCGCSLVDPEDDDSPTKIFYDTYSDRFFEATMSQVLNAEYHLNRTFNLRGYITLSEFYEFLGLESTQAHDVLGWEINDDTYWVEFNHRKVPSDDGLEYYIIETMQEPSSEFMESIYW